MELKGVLDTIMEQPIEEPMRNKEGKAESSPLVNSKAKRKPATSLLFCHIRAAAPLLNCILSIEFRLKPKG